MRRDEVKAIFPDATEEQVTAFLNQHNTEIAGEKAKTQRAKGDLQTYKQEIEDKLGEYEELVKEKEELEKAGMSEIEKMKADFDKTTNKLMEENANLQKTLFISKQRSDAVSNFSITAEQAEEVVKDDGSFDMAKLGEIMKEKEAAAALAKEQEIQQQQLNPNGGTGNGSGGADTAMEFAKSVGVGRSGVNENILKNWR